MHYDLGNNVRVRTVGQIERRQAGFTSDAIDSVGFGSVVFVVSASNFAFTSTNKMTCKVQSSDSTTSGWADIDSDDYIALRTDDGSDWDRVFDESQEHGTIGVRTTTKRYYRVVVTEAGTVDAYMAVTAILGYPRHAPTG